MWSRLPWISAANPGGGFVAALYTLLRDVPPADAADIEEGVTVDLDRDGHIVGIEILDASERLGLESLVNISIENVPQEPAPAYPATNLGGVILAVTRSSLTLRSNRGRPPGACGEPSGTWWTGPKVANLERAAALCRPPRAVGHAGRAPAPQTRAGSRTSLYPTCRTVTMKPGRRGSGSIFCRRFLM